MFVVAGYASSSNGSIKVTSHYPGLAARSGVKNDSSRMSKFAALSHCTSQSVSVGGDSWHITLLSLLFPVFTRTR